MVSRRPKANRFSGWAHEGFTAPVELLRRRDAGSSGCALSAIRCLLNAGRWRQARLNDSPEPLHKQDARLPAKNAFCLSDVGDHLQNFVGADLPPRDNRLLQAGDPQHQLRQFTRVYRAARAGVEGIEALRVHGPEQQIEQIVNEQMVPLGPVVCNRDLARLGIHYLPQKGRDEEVSVLSGTVDIEGGDDGHRYAELLRVEPAHLFHQQLRMTVRVESRDRMLLGNGQKPGPSIDV